MTALFAPKRAIVAVALLCWATAPACNSGPGIAAPPAAHASGSGSAPDGNSLSPGGRGTSTSTGGTGGTGGNTGTSGGDTGGTETSTTAAVPDGPPPEIEYPTLTFNGQGVTNCSQALHTETQIVSKLSKIDLTVERAGVHVECYSSGAFASFFGHACDEAEFNQKIMADAAGVTTYNRYTSDDAKKDGGKNPSWAIMAKSVKSNKGEVYNFDKPLPVFPMPAAIARYKDLDQPAVFMANVTGPTTAAVKMTVTKLSVQGEIVRLRFEMTLNGSADPAIYDKFPIPHASEFDVNSAALDLRAIKTDDIFVDENGCQDGGTVKITYQLCRKQTSQKVEDTQLPFCR